MKRTAPILALLCLLLVGGVAGASSTVVFGGDVSGLYRQRPSFIHITSDQNIEQIHWSSWGGRSAHGHGTMRFSASDGLAPAPVKLRLSNIRRCGKRRQYLRLAITYVREPPGSASRAAVDYTCRSPFA